nr:MAG: ORF1 [TTV-like mini virus]
MPWYNYRPRRRRWRRHWRRPRTYFRRRYWRNRWVRRRRFKKKLKKLKLTQFQPKCIRKCTVKGPICLFQSTNQRLNNDFDLYELSMVPEHLPGGGGWGIKIFSLEGLYSEHVYARNVFTRSNKELTLVRYTGCKIKLYQSEYVDYYFSYSISQPMQSSLALYNSMQPNIHSLMQHKITVPSRKTYAKKKPYIQIKIQPPTQLQNKWYFQQDFAKQPLLMTMVTATSLNKYFIDPNDANTNMNITSLNVSVFQNRNFANPGTGYWAKKIGDKTFYLYASREVNPSSGLKVNMLVPLTDTKNYSGGKSFNEAFPGGQSTQWNNWKTSWSQYQGNPFYPEYLDGTTKTYLIAQAPATLFSGNYEKKEQTYSPVELTNTIRYNPYADQGSTNQIYFKSNTKEEVNWQPPDNPELTNENLPFWVLLWGFPDWHKKIKKHLHLESAYILTMTHEPATHQKEYLVPLSPSFIQGKSPYEPDEGPTGPDRSSWYPQLQYQNEIITAICSSGPGVARLPDNYTAQAIMKYYFYFKWGGNPPQMSAIDDPLKKPTYVIPSNKYTTNSLQNPATNPESILWNFDQRRDYLTPRAIQRLQKDKGTEKTVVAGGSHFQDVQLQTSDSSEETTSEEEEAQTTLYEQLQRQRLKQLRIKHRIVKILKNLQQLE